MRHYPAATPAAPLLVFGHGAGAGENHPWLRHAAAGLATRGVSVVTFDFPYMAEGRKLPDPGPVLEKAFAAVWLETMETLTREGRHPLMFAGGKSMGGRIASQAAARTVFSPAPAGLVFFGYPLHPPAKPLMRRDRHLPDISAPMLFLHGTRDPFGSADEMRALGEGLPNATLEIIDAGDHSLQAPKRSDPNGASIEHALDRAAAWIISRQATGLPPR